MGTLFEYTIYISTFIMENVKQNYGALSVQ